MQGGAAAPWQFLLLLPDTYECCLLRANPACRSYRLQQLWEKI